MIDPEEVREQRRAARPQSLDAQPVDACTAAIEAQLARRRSEDRARRWLARWRSDRHAFERIAADEGATVAEVRTAIDAELRHEGTTLATVEQQQRNRRPRLGRSAGMRLVTSGVGQ